MKFSLPLFLLTAAPAAAELHSVMFAGRHFIPSGPGISGFGFGALESTYFDSDEQLFYGSSEEGYVSVTDYSGFPDTVSTPLTVQIAENILDLAVCGDHLFVVTRGGTTIDAGNFHVFSKSTRGEGGSLTPPEQILFVAVGFWPSALILNSDCTLAAVANSGLSFFDDEKGLVNQPGDVSLISAPFDDADDLPTVTTVSLDEWRERELLQKNVNLPLTAESMTYWSAVLGDDFDTAAAVAAYNPTHALAPKSLAFSGDESLLYVNLQVNNALVTVDVAEGKATNIVSYGVKRGFSVDVVADGGCDIFDRVDGLDFLRSPDGIATVSVNGTDYIITANEGFAATIGPFKEALQAGNIFAGDSFGLPNMTADAEIFDPRDITSGTSAPFNQDCDDTDPATPFCSPEFLLSVGSVAVDYTDPLAPVLKSMVAIGGRGISVYEVTEDRLRQRWDSGRGFELRTCNQFTYAHNGEQDAFYAPVDGPFYNSLDPSFQASIDDQNNPDVYGCLDGGDGNPGACSLSGTVDRRSLSDGPAPEAIVYGEACDTPYVITATEKTSIAFIYSLADPTSPKFDRAFSLSPISETLNPGLAFANQSIGEIDPENLQFLAPEESPTGNAAVMFAGAISGTASIYEFICVRAPTTSPSPTVSDMPSAAMETMMPTIDCSHSVCHVCEAADMEVKKPDVIIPGADGRTCAEIQAGGLAGCISAALCGVSSAFIGPCECGPKDSLTMDPTASPTASPVASTPNPTLSPTDDPTGAPASSASDIWSLIASIFSLVGLLWI